MHALRANTDQREEKQRKEHTYSGMDDGRVHVCVRAEVLRTDAD